MEYDNRPEIPSISIVNYVFQKFMTIFINVII